MKGHYEIFRNNIEQKSIIQIPCRHIIQKDECGLVTLKTITAMWLEQRLLVILYSNLVLSVIDYGRGVLTLSYSQ